MIPQDVVQIVLMVASGIATFFAYQARARSTSAQAVLEDIRAKSKEREGELAITQQIAEMLGTSLRQFSTDISAVSDRFTTALNNNTQVLTDHSTLVRNFEQHTLLQQEIVTRKLDVATAVTKATSAGLTENAEKLDAAVHERASISEKLDRAIAALEDLRVELTQLATEDQMREGLSMAVNNLTDRIERQMDSVKQVIEKTAKPLIVSAKVLPADPPDNSKEVKP